jgi:hypothetical protein
VDVNPDLNDVPLVLEDGLQKCQGIFGSASFLEMDHCLGSALRSQVAHPRARHGPYDFERVYILRLSRQCAIESTAEYLCRAVLVAQGVKELEVLVERGPVAPLLPQPIGVRDA